MLNPGGVRPARGFTIVELAITLGIVAVMAMVAMPLVRDWMQNTAIRTAAESVASGLMRARSEAVRRNEEVRFSLVGGTSATQLDASCALSPASASWVVSLETPAGRCGSPAGEGRSGDPAPRILDKHAHGADTAGIAVRALGPDCQGASTAAQVVFNGYGRALLDPAPLRCIEIRHPSSPTARALRVILSTGGTVRVCDPAVTAADDPRRCVVAS